MRSFSGADATAELTVAGKTMLDEAHAWLLRHEAGLLAHNGPGQIMDTALQGLANAEAARAGGDGLPLVRALAHQVAILMTQQKDRKAALLGFMAQVNRMLEEQDADWTAQGRA